jgi:hypothetical protein
MPTPSPSFVLQLHLILDFEEARRPTFCVDGGCAATTKGVHSGWIWQQVAGRHYDRPMKTFPSPPRPSLRSLALLHQMRTPCRSAGTLLLGLVLSIYKSAYKYAYNLQICIQSGYKYAYIKASAACIWRLSVKPASHHRVVAAMREVVFVVRSCLLVRGSRLFSGSSNWRDLLIRAGEIRCEALQAWRIGELVCCVHSMAAGTAAGQLWGPGQPRDSCGGRDSCKTAVGAGTAGVMVRCQGFWKICLGSTCAKSTPALCYQDAIEARVSFTSGTGP